MKLVLITLHKLLTICHFVTELQPASSSWRNHHNDLVVDEGIKIASE